VKCATIRDRVARCRLCDYVYTDPDLEQCFAVIAKHLRFEHRIGMLVHEPDGEYGSGIWAFHGSRPPKWLLEIPDHIYFSE
jgi:hypothetical protein